MAKQKSNFIQRRNELLKSKGQRETKEGAKGAAGKLIGAGAEAGGRQKKPKKKK
jgi:hypothetical protein